MLASNPSAEPEAEMRGDPDGGSPASSSRPLEHLEHLGAKAENARTYTASQI
jgi:hypothetical protein